MIEFVDWSQSRRGNGVRSCESIPMYMEIPVPTFCTMRGMRILSEVRRDMYTYEKFDLPVLFV